jgi:hypothetical protein
MGQCICTCQCQALRLPIGNELPNHRAIGLVMPCRCPFFHLPLSALLRHPSYWLPTNPFFRWNLWCTGTPPRHQPAHPQRKKKLRKIFGILKELILYPPTFASGTRHVRLLNDKGINMPTHVKSVTWPRSQVQKPQSVLSRQRRWRLTFFVVAKLHQIAK